MKTAIIVLAFAVLGVFGFAIGFVVGAWLTKRSYEQAEAERQDGIRRMLAGAYIRVKTTGYPVLDTHDVTETMEDYPGSVN